LKAKVGLKANLKAKTTNLRKTNERNVLNPSPWKNSEIRIRNLKSGSETGCKNAGSKEKNITPHLKFREKE